MSGNDNGRRPWIKLNVGTFLAGLLTGGIVCGVAGIMWHNWQLKAVSDDLTAMERRVSLQRTDLNALTARLDSIASQANSLGNSVSALQESVPARLPTLAQIIEQDRHLAAQDGRIDDVFRKLSTMCGQLAGISAASGKKAGC